MAERATCRCCGNEYTVNADGTMRYHIAADPECQDEQDPDSRKCRGAGQRPAGDDPEPGTAGYICRNCKHPVQLTSNGRARSHLSALTDKPCEGGSDWPLRVNERGERSDMKPGEVLPAARPGDLLIEPERSDVATAGDTSWQDGRTCEHDPVHGGFDENDEDVTVCSKCGLVLQDDPADDGTEEPEPGPEPWGTPADLLVRMPGDVQALYAERPVCWDCGCAVAPMVESFLPDGGPRSVTWGCETNCSNRNVRGQTHYGAPCRPRTAAQTRVGSLTEGVLFVRHTLKPPLNRLVYRAQGGSYGPDGPVSVRAAVVSAGPYGGRTGDLTNLLEEITCTDLDGRPRPRRDPLDNSGSAPAAPPPTLNERPERSTPSPRVQPRPPAPSRAPTSTPPSSPSAKPSSASKEAPSSRATSSGPSGTASTRTRPVPTRSAMPDAFSTAKAEVKESDKYDRYGRYRLLHPDTGKKVAWTRATTFAKSIQDTFALSQWAQRMTLKGASLRPDIVAAVSTLEVKKDKDRVNALVEDAKKAAGDKVAANLGTAVHSFTEDRDKTLVGMPVKDREVPEKLRPTVDAYEELIASFGLEPVPGLIEFTTAVKQYEICGTSDRVYRVTRDITFKLNGKTLTLYAGEYVVGDVKTGADLSYGWMEICIQLAIYAQGLNTSGVWDWGTGRWAKPVLPDNPEVLLKVRTDVAVVPHLPVDRKQGDPLATLYAIDLDEGWAAAVLCAQVRTVRKKAGSTLATALSVADVAEGESSEPVQRAAARARPVISRPPTLEEKARAVTTQADASAVWQEAVAARTPAAEVDRLVEIMKKKLESHVEQGA